MKILIYGGAFNPPHIGHIKAAEYLSEIVNPDLFIIIPSYLVQKNGWPDTEERIKLCSQAFSHINNVFVSDIEANSQKVCYSSDTVRSIKNNYPNSEIILAIGDDKTENLTNWHDFEYLHSECSFAVLRRESTVVCSADHNLKYMSNPLIEVSSSKIRSLLPAMQGEELLSDKVYSEIIKKNLYFAKPSLEYLRKLIYEYVDSCRIQHVLGCESTALCLAKMYGADEYNAAAAAILHDITKRLSYNEQLNMLKKYDIICDDIELSNNKLLHARTGAYFARDIVGISDEIFNAIQWHTTGKPSMSLLEKIIYIADYIEPTRKFEGVDELRSLAYKNIDSAVALGLKKSIEEVSSSGRIVHLNTISAFEYYKEYLANE